MFCISLFDHSGRWSEPWRATHDVVQVDLQNGQDVLEMKASDYPADQVDCVLAAPPCTHFTCASSRLWKTYDADGRTALSVHLVHKTLELVEAWQPRVVAIENPVIGRLRKLVPAMDLQPERLVFSPWEYAGLADDPGSEAYQKRTAIYGKFVTPTRSPVDRFDANKGGERGGKKRQTWISNLPPGPDRANLRSRTPQGFARAFYQANVR